MKALAKVFRTIYYCKEIIKVKWENGKRLFLLELLIGLTQEAKAILDMILPAVIIQLVMDATKMNKAFLMILGYSLLLMILSAMLEILRRSLQNHSLRALNYMILRLNKHAMQIGLQDFERNETMEQFDKAYDGLWNSSEVDYQILTVIFSKLVSFSITAYILSSVHWSVALLVTGTLIVEFLLSIRLSEKLHEIDQRRSALLHKKNYITDTIFDCKTNKEIFLNDAKAFFMGKYQESAMEELELQDRKNIASYRNDKISACIEFFRTGIVYAAAVLRYMKGFLPLADFTIYASAIKQMTYAIWQILQGFIFLFRSSDYFEDYLQYMRIETEDKAMLNTDSSSPCFLEFRNVSFKYPNQTEYAVQNLSFKVAKGETIALVGDNGAGKSTIMKLLLRLYPVTEGEILLNGKSIYTYEQKEYLINFAPVFQDYMMYAFSLRENILFDNPMDASAVNDLLKKVGLEQKIASLPKGLETPYTKRFDSSGVEFSGGDEQKLVIGRALARKGEIMVLDEPTASLDPLAEYSIYELIHGLRKDKTTFFVSHRLSTTRFSDKILVLDGGCLVEEGRHEILMAQKGLYHRMFSMQTQYYKSE